jgi:dual specificity tyrosine-phosphorylation-regulated kinase 2/3/4
MTNYPDFLTNSERDEIFNFPEIYYLRVRPPLNKTVDCIIPNHFQFVTNEHMAYRFQMLKVLAKGAFGGVIKCYDHKMGSQVAIKVQRDHDRRHAHAIAERDFLLELKKAGGKKHHIVDYLEYFLFRGFICFVLGLECEDVYMALASQKFLGFSMPIVQVICKHCADALNFAHEQGIIHCDVKPENILFTNKLRNMIRLTDFGCSVRVAKSFYTYVQSRYYRAPEVVLDIPYGPAVDIWGLGCVLVELVTGKTLFRPEDEFELVAMHAQILGNPPTWMVREGKRAARFFRADGVLILRPNSDGVMRIPGSWSIKNELTGCDDDFVGLVTKCLMWDPNQRLTAVQILEHPWVQRNGLK